MGTLTINNTYCGPITQVEYGALYNWYAATDVRYIAASGWHVPSKTEVETLQSYLGGFSIAGGKLKESGLTYWNTPNTGATNEVGFNMRGSGMRNISGVSQNLKLSGYFWTSTAHSTGFSYRSQFIYNGADNPILQYYINVGNEIRLIKDSTTLLHGQTATYTGNDGKAYRTICIGTQEWLADNLNETKYRNGDWITGFDGGVYTPIPNATWGALTTEAMCYYNDDENNG